MSLILGIDPGSRITGYGVIRQQGRSLSYLGSGCVRLPEGSLPIRLKQIFDAISELVIQFNPEECAIEKVFMAKNADSALKLGQARGAAIVAAASRGLLAAEYSPTEIKRAVVGTGRASKPQVQHMVCQLLALNESPQADAADALAVAICHAHFKQGLVALAGQATKRRQGRWR